MKMMLRAVLQSFLLTQALGCAHAPPTPSSPPDLRKSPERCTLPLLNTQEVIVAILHDLPTFYTAVNGTIIKIERVEGRYEVWVSHNERIDVVIFEATATPTCEVKLHHTGDRTVDR
jgi:hypothetical protein